MARGRILRDTNSGTGIVSIDGAQKSFTLEQHWRSGTPPKVDGIVDVELDSEGEIVGVTAVDDAALAKEQAQKALETASIHGKKYVGALVGKVGIPTLAAIAALAIAWLFLPTLSVQISSSYRESITFYEILKVISSSSGLDSLKNIQYQSAGFWGFLMFIVLLAPILPHYHPKKYLKFCYVAPLALILTIFLQSYLSIRESISQARGVASGFAGAQGAAMADRMMSEMMSMAFKAISLGFGFYIGVAVAIYLAVIGVRNYLASTAKV